VSAEREGGFPLENVSAEREGGFSPENVSAELANGFTRLKCIYWENGGANDLKKGTTTTGESPSRLIDARIKELGDWRGRTLSHVRALIKRADPDVVEEWKWDVPVWSHDGIICTGEAYKRAVKLTFVKGASLEDPSGLFNSSLEGNTRRAIDFHEDEKIEEEAFTALIRAAAALNRLSAR
jgi:hypothetical protein